MAMLNFRKGGRKSETSSMCGTGYGEMMHLREAVPGRAIRFPDEAAFPAVIKERLGRQAMKG